MAKNVTQITLGIDVSKDELVVAHWQQQTVTRLANQPAAINRFLHQLNGPVRIALEPTSHFHLALLEQAHQLGMSTYLVNPRQLVHYREAINQRNKTDPDDAWLLARYLAHEAASLRVFEPHNAKAQRLWALIKRRGVLATLQQTAKQSLRDISLPAKGLFRELTALKARIDRQVQRLIRELGWSNDYQRCLSVPGIGPLNAAALVAAYHRAAFASSDAFIAYLGLDVVHRESGRYRGQRKLSKRGEAELRRLLYCAAHGARAYPPFDRYRQSQLDKGLSKTAANIILARKLARIAFALISKRADFLKQENAYSQST